MSTPSSYAASAPGIVAVETQIQREMVAVPAGTTTKGMPCRPRPMRRVPGAIAASHAQHVGAACDCILGEPQVVTWAQHDGLDVALPAQVDQPEAFGLPPPDLRFISSTG